MKKYIDLQVYKKIIEQIYTKIVSLTVLRKKQLIIIYISVVKKAYLYHMQSMTILYVYYRADNMPSPQYRIEKQSTHLHEFFSYSLSLSEFSPHSECLQNNC